MTFARQADHGYMVPEPDNVRLESLTYSERGPDVPNRQPASRFSIDFPLALPISTIPTYREGGTPRCSISG
jgi:hypothetical protein